MKFIDLLGKDRLFFDGAMGTMLQKNGLSAGEIPVPGRLKVNISPVIFTPSGISTAATKDLLAIWRASNSVSKHFNSLFSSNLFTKSIF